MVLPLASTPTAERGAERNGSVGSAASKLDIAMPCCTRSARPPTAPSTASVGGGISTVAGAESCTALTSPGRPKANQPSVALSLAASGHALAPPMARPAGT